MTSTTETSAERFKPYADTVERVLKSKIHHLAMARCAQMPWVEETDIEVKLYEKITLPGTYDVILSTPPGPVKARKSFIFMLSKVVLDRLKDGALEEYLSQHIAAALDELLKPTNIFEAAEKMLSFSEMREGNYMSTRCSKEK